MNKFASNRFYEQNILNQSLKLLKCAWLWARIVALEVVHRLWRASPVVFVDVFSTTTPILALDSLS